MACLGLRAFSCRDGEGESFGHNPGLWFWGDLVCAQDAQYLF
jgi:hypothetical protein